MESTNPQTETVMMTEKELISFEFAAFKKGVSLGKFISGSAVEKAKRITASPAEKPAPETDPDPKKAA